MVICDPICENPALRKSEKRVVQRILQRVACALQRFAKHCQCFPMLYQRSTQRSPDEPNALSVTLHYYNYFGKCLSCCSDIVI